MAINYLDIIILMARVPRSSLRQESLLVTLIVSTRFRVPLRPTNQPPVHGQSNKNNYSLSISSITKRLTETWPVPVALNSNTAQRSNQLIDQSVVDCP